MSPDRITIEHANHIVIWPLMFCQTLDPQEQVGRRRLSYRTSAVDTGDDQALNDMQAPRRR